MGVRLYGVCVVFFIYFICVLHLLYVSAILFCIYCVCFLNLFHLSAVLFSEFILNQHILWSVVSGLWSLVSLVSLVSGRS